MAGFMKHIFSILAAGAALVSCIKNDLPYPIVNGAFSSIVVDGASSVDIDASARTVVISLPENRDPAKVTVRKVTFVNKETVCVPDITGVHDFTSPMEVNLRTYQDYTWTISAVQEIQRYFTVMGQVGATVIDVPNRRVIAYVPSGMDLRNIVVSSMKLGPEGITSYSPAAESMHDFSEGIEVNVSFMGRSEVWALYVEQKEQSVEINMIDPWTRRARVLGSGYSDGESGFRYRREGESSWTDVPDVIRDGGSFSAFIEGLEPETTYECKAFSRSEESGVYTFETQMEAQVPNGGFEAYSNDESKMFQSWYDPASSDPALNSKWWDSGNVGSTTVGSSFRIAMPDTDNYMEGRASACLVSRNVIIKFAAGNTFSGEFVRIVGTQGGVLNFGRPWRFRPRAMRFWMKYECGEVDVVDTYPSDDPVAKGDPDRSSVWIALGDWDYRKYGGTSQCPVQINTMDKSTFFDKNGENVIAYGDFFADSSSEFWAGKPEVVQVAGGGWVLVEVPFVYRDPTRRPTHMIISFASSKLGDYFTGSSKSRMWIDGITMVY